MTPARRQPISFLTDPDFEFEFFLARELQMTRSRLLAEMSNLEFIQWTRYYAVKAQREELTAIKAKRRR